WDVGSTDGAETGILEGRGEGSEPVRIRRGIVVDIRDDLPLRFGQSRVPRACQPTVVRGDDPHVVLLGDRRARVGRAVIDDDRLEVRVVQVSDSLETRME